MFLTLLLPLPPRGMITIGFLLRLAGADDRGGGVLMYAMGFANLDIGEAGGFERRTKLALSKGAGDATSPGGHVSASGVIHVRIGNHIRDRKSAARPQHPRRLREHLGLVAGEVDHAV